MWKRGRACDVPSVLKRVVVWIFDSMPMCIPTGLTAALVGAGAGQALRRVWFVQAWLWVEARQRQPQLGCIRQLP